MTKSGELEAPARLVVGSPPFKPPMDSDERLFQDLLDRFSVLAETCSRFTREVYRRTHSPPPEADPESAIRTNLGIMHAVFSPWSLDILPTIYYKQSVRLADLRQTIGHGTDETLTTHLRALEKFGLVQREPMEEPPNRVRYSLTHKGLMISRLAEPLFLYLRLAHGWSSDVWEIPSLGGTDEADDDPIVPTP